MDSNVAAQDGRVNASGAREPMGLDEDELLVIEEEQEELRADRIVNQSKLTQNGTEFKSEERFENGAYSKMSTLERELEQMSQLEEQPASQMGSSPTSGPLRARQFNEVCYPKTNKEILVSTRMLIDSEV